MPRGVPKNGFRKTKKQVARENGSRAAELFGSKTKPDLIDELEQIFTDAEIEDRLNERFGVLEFLANSASTGSIRSMIVSGPAGVGKSFTIEHTLKNRGTVHEIVKGFLKATGLFKVLYRNRHKGNVLVLDDADSVFYDEVALNFLKAVCDTGKERFVSYMSEYDLQDDETGESLPKTFEFEGTVIFLTNLDFDVLIERGHKLAPHMQALISRSHYIDLAMKTKRDYIVRIRQVARQGMMDDMGLDKEQQNDVLQFIDDNADTLRELSLRMMSKIAGLRLGGDDWKRIANVTCNKNA